MCDKRNQWCPESDREHRQSMHIVASRLPGPKWRVSSTEALRDLCEGVPTSNRTPPILRESRHREIVTCHRTINMEHGESECANAIAQVRFLASDQIPVETAHLFQHVSPNERIATTKLHLTRHIDPIEIEYSIEH